MKNIKINFSMLMLGLGLTVQAQQATITTGGNASGGGGTGTYSIGQVVYTTYTGITGSVAQGVQQPFEISVVAEIDEAEEINLMVSAFPNPTIDFLTLDINAFETSNLSYKLFDNNGKLLESKQITGNKTIISMKDLVPAIYFIIVLQTMKATSQEIKTFKIIKIHGGI